MTANAPGGDAGHDAHDELTIRVFRALHQEFDLRTVGGTHIAVPTGTPWFAGVSLGSVVRQISENEPSGPRRYSNQTRPDV